jgi:hypothetical protein
MTRKMFDSTTTSDLPAHAKMLAGYVDGNFANVDEIRDRFPDATVVTITVIGTPGAHVCDTEVGNIGIPSTVAWAVNEIEAGRKPTIYCMASAWPTVKAAVKAKGIAGKVSYWIADWDGIAEIPAGAVAKQYANPKLTHHHFDESIVADHWPGVDEDDDDPNDLSDLSRTYAERLLSRLSQRKHPLHDDRAVLVDLTKEIERVLSLH